ncbi:MAG: acyl-CoA dehydrogenase family protein, partial [Candidatus Omnitrophica bacterium]|nr:acyl-CoA dehydrogenase family protein [Candidatus Omnitrophota bacterium]
MLNYLLTEEQKMIQDLARKIAEEKIKPVSAKYDETEEFPWEIMKILAASDLFGVYIPQDYGGFGGGVLELAIVTEELSRACGGIAVCYAATGLGAYPIILFGNEEQKSRYLPDIASGKKLAAFALTEAGAGSDASAIQTTAEKKGDYYLLNGTKQWITNGGEAEVYTVIALTDRTKGARGATAFILDKGMEGFTFGKKEKKMGIRASATRELIFNNCKVPKENVLGKEGMGFIVAMKTFDVSRPGVAAQAVGIAQGALDLAIEYAKQRKQFGQSISSFQGIQFMLADMATSIEAARALIYAVCRAIDKGEKNIAKE